MQRKDAILHAASDHFGRFGFRGASLRDIARDAAVSLPLLNHHFGDKTGLLSAVVAAQSELLEALDLALFRTTWVGAGAFTSQELAQAWLRVALDTVAEPDGLLHLRLLARILDDPADESISVVRQQLVPVATAFIKAMQQCYPSASSSAVASACHCVGASLLTFLTGARNSFQLSSAQGSLDAESDVAQLASFLVAGIEAVLTLPEVDATASLEPSQPVRSVEVI